MAAMPEVGGDSAAQMIAWLRRPSLEVAALSPAALTALSAQFAPDTEVFVNFLPKGEAATSIKECIQLRQAGFNPVPHVAARAITGRAMLDDFVARLVGEAAVWRMLVIAGDLPVARGPYSSAMDLLATGVFEAHGIHSIGVAAHPEGHPLVDAATLDAALVAKRDYTAAHGIDLFIVTQFAFDAAPIVAFLDRLNRLGISTPVRIGLAGPASVATLIRFGLHCGIGASLRTLRLRSKSMGRLIGEAGLDALLGELALQLAERPQHHVSGVHFYPFGGIARTCEWLAATLSRLEGRSALHTP